MIRLRIRESTPIIGVQTNCPKESFSNRDFTLPSHWSERERVHSIDDFLFSDWTYRLSSEAFHRISAKKKRNFFANQFPTTSFLRLQCSPTCVDWIQSQRVTLCIVLMVKVLAMKSSHWETAISLKHAWRSCGVRTMWTSVNSHKKHCSKQGTVLIECTTCAQVHEKAKN